MRHSWWFSSSAGVRHSCHNQHWYELEFFLFWSHYFQATLLPPLHFHPNYYISFLFTMLLATIFHQSFPIHLTSFGSLPVLTASQWSSWLIDPQTAQFPALPHLSHCRPIQSIYQLSPIFSKLWPSDLIVCLASGFAGELFEKFPCWQNWNLWIFPKH